MVKKYRKHRKRIKPESFFSIPVKPEVKKRKTVEKKARIALTEEDQIVYIYEKDENKNISEVVNVSYQVLVNDEWVTIVRFDSEHGYLHCHRRISVKNESEIVFTANYIPRKGTPHRWLTWATQHLKKNYLIYKNNFLEKKMAVDNKTKD